MNMMKPWKGEADNIAGKSSELYELMTKLELYLITQVYSNFNGASENLLGSRKLSSS